MMDEHDPYTSIAGWYDLEHDALTEDVECYVELLAGAHEGRATLLEVGSGTGRIAAVLATAGYEVTGIEPSAAMRVRCDTRLAQLPQRVARRIHIVAGSAENLGLAPEQHYHAVLYGLNTFAHLTNRRQRQRALSVAWEHLLPGGLLLIDLDLAGPRRLLNAPGQLFLQGSWVLPASGEWVCHLVAGVLGQEAGSIAVTHMYDVFPPGETVRRTLSLMPLALLSRGELELAVINAGFEVESVYGGYDLAPFDETSGRAILLARRMDN
jgi:SAM-dependent methyltransferase